MSSTPRAADSSPDQDLGRCLSVRKIADDTWEPTAFGWDGPAFGGLLMGQAVTAVSGAAMAEGHELWSVQGTFPLSLDPRRPYRLALEPLALRRSVSTFQVSFLQNDEPRTRVIVMLGTGPGQKDSGPVHLASQPDVPGPEEGADWEVLRSRERPGTEPRFAPIEMRALSLPAPAGGPPSGYVWMRPAHPLGDDPVVHRAALAFATDLALLRTAAHPASPWRPSRALTLNHSAWFHCPHTWSDWILYGITSPAARDGRAAAHGSLYANGSLVASAAQEGLLQW